MEKIDTIKLGSMDAFDARKRLVAKVNEIVDFINGIADYLHEENEKIELPHSGCD